MLVNIEAGGPLWLEWCAALYESYASDLDPEASGPYCRTGHALAEELEVRVYDVLTGEFVEEV